MMSDALQDELLSAYLDGELDPETRRRVEEHLDQSPEDRRLVEELRTLGQSLRALPRHELDAQFRGRVLRAAERAMLTQPGRTAAAQDAGEERRPWRPVRGLRPLVWPAVAVAAAMMLMIVYRDQDQRGKQVAQGPKAPAAAQPRGGNYGVAGAVVGPRSPTEDQTRGARARAAVANGPRQDGRRRAVVESSRAARPRTEKTPAVSGRSRADENTSRAEPDRRGNRPVAQAMLPAQKGRAKNAAKKHTGDRRLAPSAGPKLIAAQGQDRDHHRLATTPRSLGHAVETERTAEAAKAKRVARAAVPTRESTRVAGAPARRLLTVRVDVSRKAVNAHAFDQILARHQIRIEPRPEKVLDAVAGRSEERPLARSAPAGPPRSAAAILARENHARSPSRAAGAKTEQGIKTVCVLALPDQLKQTLKDLQAKRSLFPAVKEDLDPSTLDKAGKGPMRVLFVLRVVANQAVADKPAAKPDHP